MKTISIVVPLFCEADNVPDLYKTIDRVTSGLKDYEWEFVMVNDGSRDGTWDSLTQLSLKDPRLKLVDLSKNFGKEVALSAGVRIATGDAVISMDGDLQHPPISIPAMIHSWEHGSEIVEMIREKSHNEPLIRRLGSRLFYRILTALSDFQIQPLTTDFRLLDRKVVDALNQITEKQRMFRGLIDWMGFRKSTLTFHAQERSRGHAGYGYGKLLNLAITSFISYSSTPLKLIGVFGVSTTLLSGSLLAWMIIWTVVNPSMFNYTPITTVVVANTFLMGLMLSALGLMSLYINKIHCEVQDRPLYIIRETRNLARTIATDHATEAPLEQAMRHSPHIASRNIKSPLA